MSNAPTLTRHLLTWTLGALVLVWATFIGVGYLTGQHEADELTDGHLASASALLLAYGGNGFVPTTPVPATTPPELKAHDYQQSMSVVVWDAAGKVVTRFGAAPLPDFSADEGFATLPLGRPAADWRTFSRWDARHDRKLMVLLSLRERDELAADIAEQVSEPGLWLLPVVAIVLGLAIRRGLRPLHDVTSAIHALDVHHAQPLALQPRHRELAGTVEAINLLVERYHAGLARERALAGELAHELRTPLAALALQARALRDAPSGQVSAQDLARLEAEALRAGDVLSHLLALARASRTEFEEAAQPVDLAALAGRLVAEYAPRAHAGGRELALLEGGALEVDGHALLLELALRNLVENALHHSPTGSLVEVQVNGPGRWVQVSDQAAGPSAPAPGGGEAVQVLGMGLGHRVVEKIAAVHGARLELDDGTRGRTSYRLVFA
ncbi:histidine kinase dimerization/phospho-acceptor domain-containing protein [Caenimonas sedimenti]|uniref:histidine kinase dimerization/phospho-acceptor domain-containing protein n=1 Tax=Caenimonas sedimenti TaxID=2596921 RepID=UPI002107A451|nr:histidine kinase dimerization/phospho-acceptor domain-containing protein [Caenimonas sedimenti]